MGKSLKDLDHLLLSIQGKVQFHSQKIKPGDVFFALKGEKTDGHAFLKEVAEKGAKLSIIDRSYDGKEFVSCVRVDSVLDTLQELAALHIEKISPKVIAITGDMGKTSTKEFLYVFLQSQGVAKNPGSFNTKISLPVTILNELKDQKTIILEMGMTKKGEIEKLISIAPPSLAAITSLPQRKSDYIHAGSLSSYEEIIRGKCEIFSNEKTAGFIPYPFKKYVENKNVQTFSMEDKSADFFGKKEGDHLLIFEKGKLVANLKLKIPGHHFSNALVASLLGYAHGLLWPQLEVISEKNYSSFPSGLRSKKSKGSLTSMMPTTPRQLPT